MPQEAPPSCGWILHDDHVTGGIGLPDIHTAEDVRRVLRVEIKLHCPRAALIFSRLCSATHLHVTGAVTLQFPPPCVIRLRQPLGMGAGAVGFLWRYNIPVISMPDDLHGSHGPAPLIN